MTKSIFFVILQFGILGLIALTGPVLAVNPWYLALETAGLLLGIWAVITIKTGNFNITPDVKPEARLVQTGPYAFIRHPMYAALLLVTLPLVLETFSLFRAALWLLLITVLVLKLRYEEQLLIRAHPDYLAYIAKTYRLIPFVF